MNARQAYETAVTAGHAPAGASVSEIVRKGSALQVAARALMKAERGLSYDAARGRVRRAAASTGGAALVDEQNSPELYKESKAAKALRENAELKSRVRRLLKELGDVSQIREHAFKLAARKTPGSANWNVITHAKSETRDIPVLFTSDFQCGEVVTLDDTRGENEYNLAIFRKRYRTLVGVTEKLIERDGGADQIVYVRGGDAISGGIHPELADTDEVPPPLQCIEVIEAEIWGIRHLADKFGKVTVISVAGNHDRIGEKPRNKAYLAHSYEALIQYAIEAAFKADKRVSFVSDPSGDVLFKVHDYSFLLTHGDRIGSGGGGSFASIANGARKVRDMYAAQRIHVDLVMCGHFHRFMYVPYDFMINGCLPGYNEYVRGRMRARMCPPSQALFYVHPDRGITNIREIDVNGRPRRARGAHVVR